MNNKKIEKYKKLRKEIIGNSCNELKYAKERYKKIIENNPNNKFLYYNPNLRDRILEDLSIYGYNPNDKGVQYLASLILIYIHERKLFRKQDIVPIEYWDLNKSNNEHFKMLGNKPKEVKNEIDKCIKNNKKEYSSLAQIVYEIADYYGFFRLDRGDPEKKSYTLTLIYDKKKSAK